MSKPTHINSETKRKLLKYQNEISVIGTAIVFFGFWTTIKAFAITILSVSELEELITVYDTRLEAVVTYAAAMILYAQDICVRFYIASSARAEGAGIRKNGKKIGNLYIVFAMIMLIANLISLVTYIISEKSDFTGFIDVAVTVIVELTSIITTAEMIRAAFMIRSMRKKLQEGHKVPPHRKVLNKHK